MDMKPTCESSCKHTLLSAARPGRSGMVPGGMRRSGCSFSQPRLTISSSPPKFGFWLMWRKVRCGISAPGASMATSQP